MDYIKLGMMSGLEIHQQLDTGKLFCRCSSLLRTDKPDFTVKRNLHKVAGETGEVDTAVEYEASLKKDFVYEGYEDTTCLIELDEEPPKLIDQNSIDQAIKIALLMNCQIYPASQIMRKTVIDGSNTSGFQRTVLIAHNGYIDTSFGQVPIETIALEEDSARAISKGSKNSTYRLDRLGIPLVEITTSPAMSNPEHVKETALKIGEILRACKVKRGIGTIRQDVNISIKKHEKVEIKGFQDPKMMIKTINTELKRQEKNVKKGKRKGELRNALPDGKTEFLRPLPGKARMYPETDLPLLRISRDQINKAKKELPRLKTEIKTELQKTGLTEELTELVLTNLDQFQTLMKVYNKDSNLVAKMITLWNPDKKITERELEQILEALNESKINKQDIPQIMRSLTKGGKIQEALKIEKASDSEVEEQIKKLIRSKPGLRPNAYMGLVMAKFKGKIDAKKAMEIINSLTN
jgi:Glu-tRNA(Gln) amidotransferase subunit E-like FAD-binding protein